MSGGLHLPQLEGLEAGLVVEWLYESIGTSAVLLALEALHRRDAQRTGELDLNQAGDHTYVAGALRAARVVSDDAATRLRKQGGH
jgi:hypothetical protein